MTKNERIILEEQRIQNMYLFESQQKENSTYIFGIDEAGRGPLCGPVVAACVVLPEEIIFGLNDSKKLSEKKREELYPLILDRALAYGIGHSEPERIDQINILNATYEAMRDAFQACVSMLKEKTGFHDPDQIMVLVDGNRTVPGIRCLQKAVVSGDAKCPSVAAASILAKVTRDRLLLTYDKEFPEYGFARHKGYGTKEHIEALKKHGPLSIHRKTFITKFLTERNA